MPYEDDGTVVVGTTVIREEVHVSYDGVLVVVVLLLLILKCVFISKNNYHTTVVSSTVRNILLLKMVEIPKTYEFCRARRQGRPSPTVVTVVPCCCAVRGFLTSLRRRFTREPASTPSNHSVGV